MAPLSATHLGALLTALSMLLFALMDAMSKLLVRDWPISEALWIRYMIYALFALAMARPRGIRRMARSARPWWQTVRALLALVEGATFVVALQYLPLADTHAVAAASPLMVVALSAPLLGERIGPNRWGSVIAGFAGVMLIIRPGFAHLSWPLFFPLLGALLWAVYQVMVRFLARDDRPETTLLWSAFVGLAAISLVAPWQFRWPDASTWALLAGVGLLGSLAHYALIRALDYAEASAVQPHGYTLLVWAALLGWLVFGDVPGVWTIAGACVVVLSGLYAWTREPKGTHHAGPAGTAV
jgi:drug/metabolite transporter (DMT)-like permease